MKKIIALILSFCCVYGAHAATDSVKLTVEKDVLADALEVFFPDATNRTKAATAYRDFVKQNDNAGITAVQLKEVCVTGGMDMNNASQKSKCQDFIQALSPVWKRKCTKEEAGYCVKNFSWINTNRRQGMFMAKMFLENAWKVPKATCAAGLVSEWNDDYIACRSLASPVTYYEFQFDDLFESVDHDLHLNQKNAICIIAGHTNDCDKPASCPSVDKIAKQFGYKASVSGNACVVEENAFTDASQLVNEYEGKIDNFVFSSSKDQTEIQAMGSLDETIKQYCAVKLAPTPITSFECEKSHRRWERGTFEDNEDVLVCHINGKRVDFVFDDLTQANVTWTQKKKIDGSLQGLGCRANGGMFDGEHCGDLTEQQCAQVAKANIKDCPGCKQAYWDKQQKICMLPASATAGTVKTVINVATNTGIAAVGLLVTVATAGTGTAAVIMITAGSAAVAAAATSDVAKIVMDNDASDWFVEMNQIQTAQQADAFLRKHLDEIMGATSLDAKRRNGLDEMLSRVLSKTSDSYFEQLVAGCVAEPQEGQIEYDESLPTCKLNPSNGSNTKQTIINVADTVQFIAGVVMIATGLLQTVKTITTRVMSVVDKLDELKNTGWIYRHGHNPPWYNQTTGEVIDKLPKGVPGWDPNPALRGGGRWRGLLYGNGNTGSFTKKADLIKWITNNRVTTVVNKVWNPNWSVVAAGTAAAATSYGEKNLANVQIPNRDKAASQPALESTSKTTQKPVFAPQPDLTSDIGLSGGVTSIQESDLQRPDTTVRQQSEPVAISAPTPVAPSRTIDPHAVDKKPNVGLIATAAVAGAALTGGLIGGLVTAKNKKDNQKSISAPAPAVPTDIEKILNVASGPFGYVDSRQISLIPLPTTVGTYAPIVTVANQAVVVVDYQNYQLPYYLDGVYKSWMPLLGIGETGGWFNVFQNPTDTGIRAVDQIRLALNKNITPSVVAKYIGAVNNGLQFPDASPAAFQIINAMFINGVVQVNNGTLSPADQALYNSNYTLLQNALK